jgi:hypothetical protein
VSDAEGERERRRLLSPRGFVTAAAVIAVVFGILHALGLRPYTSILSGTAPPGAGGGEAVLLGLVYVAAYFACVVAAPVLAIAAGIWWGWERARSARRE